jgi:hypothetical protein
VDSTVINAKLIAYQSTSGGYVKLRIALSAKSSISKYNNKERLQQDSNNPALLDITLNLCKISPTKS